MSVADRPDLDIADGCERYAAAVDVVHGGLIVANRLPIHANVAAITPTPSIFVRAHLGIPRIGRADWRLRIDGLVARPRDLIYADLHRYPRRRLEAMHQCSGNPALPTLAEHSIANVVWGGVDLRDVLDDVGLQPAAEYLWAYGLDGGELMGIAQAHYLKDIPRVRLEAGDVLIADELNGTPLDLEHGAPARLVVPGYYGNNSVKWLGRLHASERSARGLFTTRLYVDTDPVTGRAHPVREIAPESIIVAPTGTIAAGQAVEIWGRAWGATAIASVDISVDDGESWMPAAVEPRRGWAWQRFAAGWTPPAAGAYVLCSRAMDRAGIVQPAAGARNEWFRLRLTVL